jgi:hypothetical protein
LDHIQQPNRVPGPSAPPARPALSFPSTTAGPSRSASSSSSATKKAAPRLAPIAPPAVIPQKRAQQDLTEDLPEAGQSSPTKTKRKNVRWETDFSKDKRRNARDILVRDFMAVPGWYKDYEDSKGLPRREEMQQIIARTLVDAGCTLRTGSTIDGQVRWSLDALR